MSLDTESRNAQSVDTVNRLQEMLQSVERNVLRQDIAAIGDCLDILSERLMRIRCWGGGYSMIDFSPEVKSILQVAARQSGKMLVS